MHRAVAVTLPAEHAEVRSWITIPITIIRKRYRSR
jgi:hypothetical protein